MSPIITDLLNRLAAHQDVFRGFIVEVILANLIFIHYRKFGPTQSNQQTFGPVLVFVALTTFLVISVIRGSFALSLGLVGALSIVRFRTPVKDPGELAYIFLAISSGIGTAAGARAVTLIIVVVILLIMTIMRRTVRDASENVFLSIDLADVNDAEKAFATVRAVVTANALRAAFMRYEAHANVLHLTATLELPDQEAMARITNQIRQHYPASNLSFYDESQLPPP